MTQTLAIFYDAYRGLRARKMFWIVLIISALVVAIFACTGISDKGLTFIVWELHFGPNTNDLPAGTFYKLMFVTLGIEFWLSWLAAILALISTAGMFPSFIASGSIDLVVARPISRPRLFLTQYAAGLLFVTLQITIFCLASFLVIGVRGAAWEPGIFLAIPLVVCFFSYLFSVCALFGMLTRSTVASLLLTILIWLLLAGLHSTDVGLLTARLHTQQGQTQRQARIEAGEAKIKALETNAEQPTTASDERSAQEHDLEKLRRRHDDAAGTLKTLEAVHRVIRGVKAFLPKTAETIDLLERTLVRTAELPGIRQDEQAGPPGSDRAVRERATKQVVDVMRSRSAAWIIGTSLAFELVMLALASWIFYRRDF